MGVWYIGIPKGASRPTQSVLMRLYRFQSFVCVLYDRGGADVSAVGRGLAWHLAAVWREAGRSGACRKGTPSPPTPPVCVRVLPSIFPPFFLEEVCR